MADVVRIPMFPLSILPLPGELVPLHIFEPRYRQLLQDVETSDTSFGIFFSNERNEQKLGSLMKLESVIKRYSGGETDIIVKCEDIFNLELHMRSFGNKMYPGGEVRFWRLLQEVSPGHELYDLFLTYLRERNIQRHLTLYTIYQIALELNLDVSDRYRFLTMTEEAREGFLIKRVRFQLHLLQREEKSKDNFHLN
jgi:Lon protease-like protein